MKPAGLRPWQAEESLADLTLYGDWDSVASMILSLRIHWFEYGTIPTWNFMFCGGRPELSVPYSWAYTWPSVFAYALTPNYAILAVWTAMTVVGLLATRALLLRWTGSSIGAWVGACLFVFSGYFAARFNAGHVTFAFFHLVPVLMLLFELGFARALERRPTVAVSAAALLASFLFTSAALPHALIHFYPVFILLVVVRVTTAARRSGVAAVRAAVIPLAANLLGVWLGAYKLWSVIRWQLDSPRTGVRLESYGLTDVIANTLTFVPNYFAQGKQQSWHVFSSWEYNAFVGPLPWLLLLGVLTGWRRRTADARPGDTIAFALFAIAAGLALGLGNDNPISPAYLFANVPVFDGVRAFSRYQVLIVFGLAVMVAHGFREVSERVSNPKYKLASMVAITLGILVPVLLQAAALLWNISAESNEQILAEYGGPGGNPPSMLKTHGRRLNRSRHETSLLEGGHWVASCNSDLTLPGPPSRRGARRVAISAPPPERLEHIGRNEIVMRYEPEPPRRVTLNLLRGEGTRVDVPHELHGQRISFDIPARPSGLVTASTDYPGPRDGAAMSAVGAVVSAIFLWGLRHRERAR